MPTESAWLLDLYTERDCIVLWFITESWERLRLVQPFAPSIFIDGIDKELTTAQRKQLARVLNRSPGLEAVGPAQRMDFWSNLPRRVLEVRLIDLDRYQHTITRLSDQFPDLTYYNCDIPPEVMFCYHTGLFPTARCTITHEGGFLQAHRVDDDAYAAEYPLPPLRTADIDVEGVFIGQLPQLHAIKLTSDGETLIWDEGPPEEILLSFRDQFRRIDPDVVYTRNGDSLVLATLFGMAQQLDIDLHLDREPAIRRNFGYEGRSFVSYGRVLYHAPDYPFFGRWHLDRDNSFWFNECGLEGLVEIARVCKTPVQRAARRSIGLGITMIQLDWAYSNGYLIPWRKSQHEAWKSAAQFIRADRGGLVYQPITGVYEDVWELDFASMYPSIMVNENVSPETVNCACCEPSLDVPELGYTICRRRKGLTAQTLAPIIGKRETLKGLRNEAKRLDDTEGYSTAHRRQSALKWLLVCCFGYLGYRNARFGRIEAHETTCAFSREKLLAAKQICEDRGFRMIHAIVDCFWLSKSGTTREEIETLCDEINRATHLKIAIEGRYSWIAFLPSKPNPLSPVPNRYVGRFESGEVKYRGIELRRSDQVPFVRSFQADLLDRLARASTLAECRAMREDLLAMLKGAEAAIRNYEVPIEMMLLDRKTSKATDEYRNNSMTAVAARQAVRFGIDLHAGQHLRFLVIRQKDKDPDSRIRIAEVLRPEDQYDVAFYVDQLHRAALTLLEPLADIPAFESAPAPKSDQPANRPRIAQMELFNPAIRC